MRDSPLNFHINDFGGLAVTMPSDRPLEEPIGCCAKRQRDKSGGTTQTRRNEKRGEREHLRRAEKLEVSRRNEVQVLLRREVHDGEWSTPSEQQGHLVSLPRRDGHIRKGESALRTAPRSNPEFSVNVGPRRTASVDRLAGDLFNMIGGNHFAGNDEMSPGNNL